MLPEITIGDPRSLMYYTEEEIDDIMNNIMEDSNLGKCREALEAFTWRDD